MVTFLGQSGSVARGDRKEMSVTSSSAKGGIAAAISLVALHKKGLPSCGIPAEPAMVLSMLVKLES